MDKFLMAANVATISDEVKQNNEEVKADFARLLSIVSMLVDTIGDFILMVNVTPVNIMLTKFEEVKDLQFIIVQNPNYSYDESQIKEQECKDLFESLISGEFPMVGNVKPLKFVRGSRLFEPSVTVYSIFPPFNIEACNDGEYVSLFSIINSGKYTLSLSGVFDIQGCKTVFVHCKNATDLLSLKKDMMNSKEMFGVDLQEYVVDKKYTNCWVYVPVIGHSQLNYGIPLVYIDFNSFNMQRLYSYLKPVE